MPEGDTVFQTAAALRDALVGKTLTRCDVRVPRFAAVDLSGERVDEVLSRGKHLFIRVGAASIHSHLKMDGSWQIGPVRAAAHKVRIVLAADGVTASGVDLGVLEILDRATDLDSRRASRSGSSGDGLVGGHGGGQPDASTRIGHLPRHFWISA